VVKNKGLGKGFGSLLPENFDASILSDKKDRVQMLAVEKIVADPSQPRKHFDKTALDELAKSIKRYGVLQPLVVTPKGDDFIVIAGERRLRAAKNAGLKTVPALVRSTKELEKLEISLIENVQRVDLSPLEQATSIARLHEQFNLSYQDIANRLGKANTTVVNTVRLLQLPTKAREALEQGKLSEGHARAVLALRDKPDAQNELVTQIQKQGLSVRAAEQFVNAYKSDQDKKTTKSTNVVDHVEMSNYLGQQVWIKQKNKGGSIEIRYSSQKELLAIIKKIIKK